MIPSREQGAIGLSISETDSEDILSAQENKADSLQVCKGVYDAICE